MAGGKLLTLIDDIATILDDVSVMTKVAAKKTAGVLGDDLALNAEQVTGVEANRELPVIWAVAKGAALNKVILVPAALAISVFLPAWVLTGLLMLGGSFLSYEGFHKVWHKLFHRDEEKARKSEMAQALSDPDVDMVEWEKEKIKGAVRTDFILSAEIIVITLGTVTEEPITTQLGVLVIIATMMNVGVYGLVAGIVKLDDLGLALREKDSEIVQKIGDGIVTAAPWLMKTLGVLGTAAMFLVGGGILAHGIPFIEHLVKDWSAAAGDLDWLVSSLLNGAVGVIAGGLIVLIVSGVKKIKKALGGESE